LISPSPEPPAVIEALLSAFGPQGWWPVATPGGHAARYHPGRFPRPVERQAFEICAGAILTQNTAWINASRAVEALRRAGALDPGSIARMSPSRLEELIRPSGFFVQKALKLKAFVRHLLRRGPLVRWLKLKFPGGFR
jgi:endonuclease-3 related protein